MRPESRTVSDEQLRQVADTIRGLSIDAVQAANSGHPGMPMGMADVAAVLWLEHLRWVPDEPDWLGRDRFVLSAGHGSMLLYSLLHLAGYDLPIEELKNFRQLGSKTPGHPEYGLTPGVETTTGPLGQGLANGVGMALAAQMECERFDCPTLRTRVFGIVSDGDLMEGISQEAASIAGHLKLDNLVYLYDDNEITIDGSTDRAWSDDTQARFQAAGWRTFECDGHDFASIRSGLEQATKAEGAPVLIRCRTRIGKGSPNKEGTSGSHGAPLGADEVARTKENLGLPPESFHVPDDVRTVFVQAADRNRSLRNVWRDAMQAWRDEMHERHDRWEDFHQRRVPDDLFHQLLETVDGGAAEGATRALASKVLQRGYELVPSLVGGSADLNGSTKTDFKESGLIGPLERKERNIAFGVREHAMGAILNGLALHGGYLPLGSTFLVFSDYCRPAIRLAGLMKLPVAFVFTHDSVMVGEDGPTHQPIEQTSALRLIPNVQVWRPADGVECAAAWTSAIERRDGPTVFVLTRQNVELPMRDPAVRAEDARRGGYIVHEPKDAVATVIATGSETGAVRVAADKLRQNGKPIRVVSMPCVEVFLAQDEAWRSKVLGDLPVFAVELGTRALWTRFTGDIERVIGIDHFGESAPWKVLRDHFGFTPEKLAGRLAELV